jgi:hypothetical protein
MRLDITLKEERKHIYRIRKQRFVSLYFILFKTLKLFRLLFGRQIASLFQRVMTSYFANGALMVKSLESLPI